MWWLFRRRVARLARSDPGALAVHLALEEVDAWTVVFNAAVACGDAHREPPDFAAAGEMTGLVLRAPSP